MIQIGAQRAGQLVVCPQCGERLTVPEQSVAQAETLYQFLKQKRLAEKNKNAKKVAVSPSASRADSPASPSSPASSSKPSLRQSDKLPLQKAVSEKRNEDNGTIANETIDNRTIDNEAITNEELDEEPNFSLEEWNTEDVDRWIKEFWTTRSREEPLTADRSQTATPPVQLPVSPMLPVVADRKTAAITMRQQETWFLFRTWLIIVFLFGLVGGFGLCSFFNGLRKNISEDTGSAKPVLSAEHFITGKLYYRGFDGERTPDADAVVLLLPLDRIPTFPISGNGFRSDDNHHASMEDSVQQIKEMGGMFQRTDADGQFVIPYENQGRYLLLLISSHIKRSDTAPDTATIRELKRFFRNPQDLLGDYSFSREEYELDQGKYMIRQTF
jgi:hypothetical protein